MSTVTRVYSNVRGLSTAIKDVGRLRQILTVLVRHGFGAAVTQLNLTDVVGIRGLMQYRDEEENVYSTARRIRMSIEELGPTFIKLGQILSTRPDLVPEDVVEELQYLQDDVPQMGFEDVRTMVEGELDGTIEELFASFEEEPLASASIAQVHRAVLPDEQPVVVKVQRPGISTTIESDLNILYFLARRSAQLIPELELADPVGIVTEFEKAILKEIDFANERNHIGKFRKNFEGFDGVRAPVVFDQYCTSRVLTMEFIDGVKVTRAPELLGADPYELAPRMLKALFKMIFQDGYFHGDLHPGNILIEEDGTIALIDFGLVGRLTPQQRDNILDIMIGMIRQDYELISRIYFDVGIKRPGVDYDFEAFQADVIEVMEKHVADKTLSEIDVGAFFGDLVSGAIRHQIQMPPTYTMVFKALVTVQGIGTTLAPEVNLIEEVQPFAREMLLERYSPRRLVKEAVDTLTNASRFLRQFPQTATQLLRNAEQGRLILKVEMQKLDRLLEEQQRSSSRQMRAILVGAFVLSGTLALDHPGDLLLGLNGVSFTLYVLALLFGAPLLLHVIGRR